jgi:hypothetical protein
MYFRLDQDSFKEYKLITNDHRFYITFKEPESTKKIDLSNHILERVAFNICNSCDHFISGYNMSEKAASLNYLLEDIIGEDVNLSDYILDNPEKYERLCTLLNGCPGFLWAKGANTDIRCIKGYSNPKKQLNINFPDLHWILSLHNVGAYLKLDYDYNLIFPNVNSVTGLICWGDVDTFRKMFRNERCDINFLVSSFWNSEFNFDYLSDISPALYIDYTLTPYKTFYKSKRSYENDRRRIRNLNDTEKYNFLGKLPFIRSEYNANTFNINTAHDLEQDIIGIFTDDRDLVYKIKAEDDKFYYGERMSFELDDNKKNFVKIKKNLNKEP